MNIAVQRTEVDAVQPFRELYRHESNCQIIHDAGLRRGFAEPYLISADGRTAGYGAVFTKHYPGRLMEFYVFPKFRDLALPMFRELLAVSKAEQIEAQSNMPLALAMLIECGSNISAESVLFRDAISTDLKIPGGIVRLRKPSETTSNQGEPDGDWLLDVDGKIVANGGFLTHYNPPYGDIYMETAEPFRRQGYGSFLVQELKRVCYESGLRPAARCDPENIASRRTLVAAGFQPVGHLLAGDVSGF